MISECRRDPNKRIEGSGTKGGGGEKKRVYKGVCLIKERAFFFRLDMGALSVRAFDSTVMDPNFPLVCVQTPPCPNRVFMATIHGCHRVEPEFPPGT